VREGFGHGHKPIADYGVIGNLHTVAPVGLDGSIDWCCFPHLDRPSVFANSPGREAPAPAPIGSREHGRDTGHETGAAA
jgi:GH15 family glucan-1,4-alpha-glucosidase